MHLLQRFFKFFFLFFILSWIRLMLILHGYSARFEIPTAFCIKLTTWYAVFHLCQGYSSCDSIQKEKIGALIPDHATPRIFNLQY